jgi:DNA-directed RNA polymerase specialized sigma subunit
MDGSETQIINDSHLVENVQENNDKSNDSLTELIGRHSALCFDIYKKYSSAMAASGICVSEMYKERTFIIYKAAQTFDPSRKVKFSTWVGNQVRYQCLNAINGNHLYPVDDSQLDYYVDKSAEESQSPDLSNDMDFVFNILDQLKDKRIKKVFKLRYFGHPTKKLPWSQVAGKISTSTQTAINLHERGKEILNRKMKNSTSYYPDTV